MPATPCLSIRDESATGVKLADWFLEFLTEKITVRELIRSRVYQEVQDYNLKHPEHFRGLVQPGDSERTTNGFKQRAWHEVDWKKQFEKAVEAFEANRLLILVNDKQAESLEENITISPSALVTFIQLTPLVGG